VVLPTEALLFKPQSVAAEEIKPTRQKGDPRTGREQRESDPRGVLKRQGRRNAGNGVEDKTLTTRRERGKAASVTDLTGRRGREAKTTTGGNRHRAVRKEDPEKPNGDGETRGSPRSRRGEPKRIRAIRDPIAALTAR
jgi:hypothetical protein